MLNKSYNDRYHQRPSLSDGGEDSVTKIITFKDKALLFE